MNATAVAGGDEDVRQMCATVAQAAVPARVAMLAVHRRCQLLFRTRWLLPNRAHGPVYSVRKTPHSRTPPSPIDDGKLH